MKRYQKIDFAWMKNVSFFSNKISLWFAFLLILVSESSVADEKSPPQLLKADTALFVKWGDQNGDVAFRTKNESDPMVIFEVPIAVNSFWVENDETIFLLEGGKKLKKFRRGKYVGTIDVGKHGYVNDFAISGDHIYAITLHDFLEFSKSGDLIRKKRVFGIVKGGEGVERLIYFKDLFALKRTSYIAQEKENLELSHACMNISSFTEYSCGELEQVLNTREILDSDGVRYVWNNLESNRLSITLISSNVSHEIGIDIVKASDNIEFLYNALIRIRGRYLYLLSPERSGLRILKYNVTNQSRINESTESDSIDP